MTLIHQILLITVLLFAAGLIISVSNALTVKHLASYPAAKTQPFVSILVPARNEEKNIEKCVSSLLQQDYPNFEVIVLNDNSTDQTPFILKKFRRDHSNLRVINGLPLPAGGPGKHWACHQLGQAAKGEFLLFTDADTFHAPSALRHAVNAMQFEQADLISALPNQEVGSFGEKLVVPFMNFAILSFLPLRFGQKHHISALSVTIGQFMMFRREAYQAVGGYASAIENVNDDVLLGRNIIDKGYKWKLLNGSREVSCRMYHNFAEVFEGFSKNIFGFFDYRILPFTIAWLGVAYIFLEPFRVILKYLVGVQSIPAADYHLAVLILIESLILFYSAYHRMGIPHYLAFLYPLTIFFFTTVALFSMLLSLTGKATWKGRELKKVEVKWF
jgi:chlorobactene glucosyltransferase